MPAPPISGAQDPQAQRLGAYGVALTGEALGSDIARWLPEVPDDWPLWEIRRELAVPAERPSEEYLDEDRCTLLLFGATSIEIDRPAQRMTLSMPESEPTGGVLHPGTTLATMVLAHWRGALNLHAGAVLLHGRVWGLLGHKGAGKSTTLAALDHAGHPVLADDMLVFDGPDVLVGPRFVDLRETAAPHFPSALDCGRMGMRRRFRMPLQPAPLRAPFAGWILPDWADEVTVTSVPPVDRLATLEPLLNIRRPPKDPFALLDAMARPLLRITRPRSFEALPDYLEAIVRATEPA